MSTVTIQSAGVSCRAITKDWGNGTRVLDGIDFNVAPGEWVSVIGPNGAGKSTLLHCIAQLTDFDGSVTLDSGSAPAPVDVALVPQNPLLPLGMSVAEYVLLGRTAYLGWLARESAADRDSVISTLRRLDLSRFADRPVTALSGGEAQRVVVARALVQRSPIVLLDEPTSALDIGHQTAVLEMLDEMRRADGITVIAAMHDLGHAARFSDRLLLLSQGSMAAVGTPTEVLTESILSQVYATKVRVRTVDDELVILPAPRG